MTPVRIRRIGHRDLDLVVVLRVWDRPHRIGRAGRVRDMAPLSIHWNENGALPSTTTLKVFVPRSLTVTLAGLVRIVGATAAPCTTVLMLSWATSAHSLCRRNDRRC